MSVRIAQHEVKFKKKILNGGAKLNGIVGDRQRSNESSVQVKMQRNICPNVIVIMLPVDDFLTEVAPIFAVE